MSKPGGTARLTAESNCTHLPCDMQPSHVHLIGTRGQQGNAMQHFFPSYRITIADIPRIKAVAARVFGREVPTQTRLEILEAVP